MGRGDNLMATGIAKGAAARGKRIAFGNSRMRRIAWDKHSEEVFRGNPNIAPPGSELDPDLEWVPFFHGHRLYNRMAPDRKRWIWNMEFRAIPGEMFFTEDELAWAASLGSGFVVMEPNADYRKEWAYNKDWSRERYQEVANGLMADGREIVQFVFGELRVLAGARLVAPPTFRHTMAALARASLCVSPEGGMHHGAAAVGVPAVVLFGGFIPPQVTGYSSHINIARGNGQCGSLFRCAHCHAAMNDIPAEEVLEAARRLLRPKPIVIEIAPGELCDKISILEIKQERIIDHQKLRNVRYELGLLRNAMVKTSPQLDVLCQRLKAVNVKLWNIEDAIRMEEMNSSFGTYFVELARAVYHNNDERAAIKKEINLLLGSSIVEEKSYGVPVREVA